MKEDENIAAKSDCLVKLPEPLLHHILSYLSMNDVIRTSVLAKRWRYLWLYVPCLTFSPMMKMIRSEEVAFINRSLLLHKSLNVQKLNITFYYSTEALVLDSWIHFALTRNVNQLYLDFTRCSSHSSKYTLHDIIFKCSSLTVLALKSCRIQLPVKIKLSSLKTLSFEDVSFYGGPVNDLLSSCSNLEDLSFANCFMANNPNLAIMNSGVKTLKIWGGRFLKNSRSVIIAPFIVSFELIGARVSKFYVIKRMESLRSASIVCRRKSDACHGRVCTNLKNLEYLCHVKDLRMCSCYIQAMSSKENRTQDCREKHIMDSISFDVTCLRIIRTGLMKWELPGIAYILSHLPNVETLIVSIDMIQGKKLNDNFQEEYWNFQEQKFVNMLCNLKDVKIYNFMKNLNLLESKQMSTCTSDDFLARLKNDMNFLKFLLKNSRAMERMTITTFKKVNLGSNSENKKLKLLFQLTQELLTFPRASQATQIFFN
ncbi:hypothetical protein Vadar_006453 [Vaccinium darrowii]|uniref:Uncharacterized protein n=1 Tax=Vaccinium darrowii TaxID=229202 RepID=A0ACB7Z221_9ERIC|nr:hypothetical protein Vadar_006453 [Vaccinium darrowii]